MRTFIFTMLMVTSITTMAQFNTLGSYHKEHKSAIRYKEPEPPTLDEDTCMNDTIPPETSIPKIFSKPLEHIHVTSNYGWRFHPVLHRMKFHSGVDLKAKMYTPVYAMFPSIVVRNGYDSASGNYVVLQTGAVTVTYCHLSASLYPKGTEVCSGSLVAFSGNTGRSTGPHLHCSIKINSKTVNPALLLMR